MRDVILMLLVVGFFALAAAYVKACAALIRSHDERAQSETEVPA